MHRRFLFWLLFVTTIKSKQNFIDYFSRLFCKIQGFQGLEFGPIKFKAFQDFQGPIQTLYNGTQTHVCSTAWYHTVSWCDNVVHQPVTCTICSSQPALCGWKGTRGRVQMLVFSFSLYEFYMIMEDSTVLSVGELTSHDIPILMVENLQNLQKYWFNSTPVEGTQF